MQKLCYQLNDFVKLLISSNKEENADILCNGDSEKMLSDHAKSNYLM